MAPTRHDHLISHGRLWASTARDVFDPVPGRWVRSHTGFFEDVAPPAGRLDLR